LLRTRIFSAVILAPPVLLAIYLGGLWFAALIVLAAGLMGWEWARMTGGGRLAAPGIAVIAALAGLPVAFHLGGLPGGVAWLLAGFVVAAVAGLVVNRRQAAWLLPGLLYIGLACLAVLWLRLAPLDGLVLVVWLRNVPEEGRNLVFWLLAVVWATDIGAYFAGRGIGGPRLAPMVSPNKTWAGLIGGMAAAAAVGLAAALVLDWPLWPPVFGGALLAVVAQGGDLLESWCKRKFGVKDSSHIIPGHGGILDRVDGLLSVFPVAFFYFWAVGASF